ncbi:MAG: FecR domain-containing protein [Verrucomicrobia bacterium]|nr:FecR domain-containing protein [Verrucomicrobiota bacterium]
MNDSLLSQMIESAQWLMLDPVVPEHVTAVVGLCLVLGLLSFRKMAESLGASNWSMPMAVLSYALGLGAMIGGLAVADMVVLSHVPTDVPLPAYAAAVLAVMLLAVAAPIGKFLMKCGYAATASAWVTALMVSALIVFFADLGFTHYGPKMARVVDLKGTVSYRPAKGEPQEEIKRRRIGLPVGAEITTKAGASAMIDLGESNYLLIRPLSVVRIVAIGEKTSVEVDVGRVIGSVLNASKTKFQIRTPAATTVIVGTDFIVESDSARQTFVTVASGKVALTSNKNGGQAEVSAGQTANCPNGSGPTPPRPADPGDLKAIQGFKAALSDALGRRNKESEN